MRKKVYKCAECGTELCVGDKAVWIEQRNYCENCALVYSYRQFAEFEKNHPARVIDEKEIFLKGVKNGN